MLLSSVILSLSLTLASAEVKNYVVSVKSTDIDSHLSSSGNVIHNKASIGDFSSYQVSLDEDLVGELSSLPEVLSVEEEQEYFPDSSWGLDRINQRDLPLDGDFTYSGDGSGVNVYVIDTGIETSIGDFGGRAVWGTNLIGDGIDTDCHGHGTHVAGTIGSDTYGIATNADLIAVKVFSCSGGSPTSVIIAAVDWATAHCLASGKRCIINMSLGGGASAAMNAAVAASTAAGVHNIVAAGNDNIDACLKSPASEPTAVTVASSTITDSRSDFSNWGTCVDIFAPGSDITSWNFSGTSWTISGTSMATPHVAGVAARLLGEIPMTPAEMVTKLSTLATTGKITDPMGSTNLLLYIPTDSGSIGDLDAPDSNSVVFYYEVTGEELERAQALGYTTVVPTAAEWAAMTTANFETYRAIILGDPHCHGDEDLKLDGAEANKAVWTPAVTGNVLVHTFDPSWHHVYGSDAGALAFLDGTVDFVASISDKTGFYFSSSCYNFADDSYYITILDGFGEFIGSPSFYGDDIFITDTAHPSMIGSTDASLSGWSSSVHNFLTSFPADFVVVAIAEHPTGSDYSGVLGYPVLVVRDVSSEPPFTCDDKSHGYQECFGDDEYHECVWGSHMIRPVAPGTKCCNWSAAERIMMVASAATCPF